MAWLGAVRCDWCELTEDVRGGDEEEDVLEGWYRVEGPDELERDFCSMECLRSWAQ